MANPSPTSGSGPSSGDFPRGKGEGPRQEPPEGPPEGPPEEGGSSIGPGLEEPSAGTAGATAEAARTPRATSSGAETPSPTAATETPTAAADPAGPAGAEHRDVHTPEAEAFPVFPGGDSLEGQTSAFDAVLGGVIIGGGPPPQWHPHQRAPQQALWPGQQRQQQQQQKAFLAAAAAARQLYLGESRGVARGDVLANAATAPAAFPSSSSSCCSIPGLLSLPVGATAPFPSPTSYSDDAAIGGGAAAAAAAAAATEQQPVLAGAVTRHLHAAAAATAEPPAFCVSAEAWRERLTPAAAAAVVAAEAEPAAAADAHAAAASPAAAAASPSAAALGSSVSSCSASSPVEIAAAAAATPAAAAAATGETGAGAHLCPLFSLRQLNCGIETVWGPPVAAAGAPGWRLHLHAALCGFVLGGSGSLRVVEGEREEQVVLSRGSAFCVPPLIPHLFAASAETPLVMFVTYSPPLSIHSSSMGAALIGYSGSYGANLAAAAAAQQQQQQQLVQQLQLQTLQHCGHPSWESQPNAASTATAPAAAGAAPGQQQPQHRHAQGSDPWAFERGGGGP